MPLSKAERHEVKKVVLEVLAAEGLVPVQSERPKPPPEPEPVTEEVSSEST